jgi:hypothetical protein
MSIKNILIATGLLSVLTIGSISTFASTNNISTDTKQALLSGDFTKFKASRKAQIDNMTETQFKYRSDKFKSMDAVNSAIDKCDYQAFLTAIANSPRKQNVNEAEFKVMCDKNKEMKANWQKVQDSIKANDFNAYKTAMATIRPNRMNKTPNEAKMQERFNMLVEKFKADGSLPEFGMMGRGGRMMK